MTAAAAAAAAGTIFSSPRQLHAEEPPADDHLNRKPIYDDSVSSNPPPASAAHPESYRPTPTDRLAVHIGYARLAVHKQAIKAEDAVNSTLTRALRLEHSFTSTVRSLAPPKESNEKLLPGMLYVLVASMAGSIVTRNRNILLRATVPAAIGLGAAYAVIPLTMKNVGDLAWTYEERFPALAEAHLQTKERMQRFVETGKAHTAMSLGMVTDKVGETREKLEDWVKKGR
ncbi:apolipo protein O-domain-containing protein [Clohesyomyces aquaticus]|uniref:MICOS complex subunit n=1 Tax=Clohesyomyces aquaticus TaxID=1231657 RepID=A0A1Y2A020_9PLEO|nr:apolipo protein O-domain-containing protein [Clohesyomyces aquaticus]